MKGAAEAWGRRRGGLCNISRRGARYISYRRTSTVLVTCVTRNGPRRQRTGNLLVVSPYLSKTAVLLQRSSRSGTRDGMHAAQLRV